MLVDFGSKFMLEIVGGCIGSWILPNENILPSRWGECIYTAGIVILFEGFKDKYGSFTIALKAYY